MSEKSNYCQNDQKIIIDLLVKEIIRLREEMATSAFPNVKTRDCCESTEMAEQIDPLYV